VENLSLRKIHIENLEYVYTINHSVHTRKIENDCSILTIKIWLNGRKQTPLIIEFITWCDPIIGNPLFSGFDLENKINGTIERVNINEPKIIKKLTIHGIENGWTGLNEIKTQDGIEYLNYFGYNTEKIICNM